MPEYMTPSLDARLMIVYTPSTHACSSTYELVLAKQKNNCCDVHIFLLLCRNAFRQEMSQLTESIGYTTIDLGVAPRVVKLNEDGLPKTSKPLEMLKSVKGNIVSFPLEFMKDEDLRPMFHEGEFYTSPEVFH